MSLPWYATREQLTRAFGGSNPAERWQTDRALEAASRSIDGTRTGTGSLKRRLYPEVATRTFPIPCGADLDLSPYFLISATSIDSGGSPLVVGNLRFQPQDGPPYDSICLNPNINQSWPGYGDGLLQVSIAGLWGYSDSDTAAGLEVGAVNASATTVVYTNPTERGPVGAGSVIRVGSERMIVTGNDYSSTAVTITADMGDLDSDNVCAVGSANLGKFATGDTVIVDAETLLITARAGNNLIVRRGWDGSTLDTHTTGATVYAPRTLTVERGALGTSAAGHSDADPIFVWQIPALVNTLCIAEAMNIVQNELAAWGRIEGADQNSRILSQTGLEALREQVAQHFAAPDWLGV